ncbi:DNA translocase FtsK [Brevibacillus sp. HD1.4A]|uniref:DNA translocase FtsK n=1 Tax=Brevibacillus sp. HD1.4A TaxID=2738978 RepID=UPI00156AD7C6|nr:DNA translocase FtsK [Brevibacillus sp. HD1.4A]NRQ54414.1 DNA translocase FtsK [Brevibacillus sp. HD1.4A]
MWLWLQKLMKFFQGEEEQDEVVEGRPAASPPPASPAPRQPQAKTKSIYPKERVSSRNIEDARPRRDRQFRFPVVPDDYLENKRKERMKQQATEEAQRVQPPVRERREPSVRESSRESFRAAREEYIPDKPIETGADKKPSATTEYKRETPRREPVKQPDSAGRAPSIAEGKKAYQPSEIVSPVYGKITPATREAEHRIHTTGGIVYPRLEQEEHLQQLKQWEQEISERYFPDETWEHVHSASDSGSASDPANGFASDSTIDAASATKADSRVSEQGGEKAVPLEQAAEEIADAQDQAAAAAFVASQAEAAVSEPGRIVVEPAEMVGGEHGDGEKTEVGQLTERTTEPGQTEQLDGAYESGPGPENTQEWQQRAASGAVHQEGEAQAVVLSTDHVTATEADGELADAERGGASAGVERESAFAAGQAETEGELHEAAATAEIAEGQAQPDVELVVVREQAGAGEAVESAEVAESTLTAQGRSAADESDMQAQQKLIAALGDAVRTGIEEGFAAVHGQGQIVDSAKPAVTGSNNHFDADVNRLLARAMPESGGEASSVASVKRLESDEATLTVTGVKPESNEAKLNVAGAKSGSDEAAMTVSGVKSGSDEATLTVAGVKSGADEATSTVVGAKLETGEGSLTMAVVKPESGEVTMTVAGAQSESDEATSTVAVVKPESGEATLTVLGAKPETGEESLPVAGVKLESAEATLTVAEAKPETAEATPVLVADAATENAQPAPQAPVIQLPNAGQQTGFQTSPAAGVATPGPSANPPASTAQSSTPSEPSEAEIAEPPYCLPTLALLNPSPPPSDDDDEHTQLQKLLLEETLSNFNVSATVVGIVKGPSVTRFELQPAPGVKVNKITGLVDDIKLNLAAKDIRIEAPIPGRNAIGIEVPNLASQPVLIEKIIGSEKFQQHSSPLAVALGMDIGGEPIIADIKKMPHGLIAGSTGSGKSVCINSIIVSLLYKATPEQVRLLLIDPKMVELAPYNHLPHLVTPVVTDAKQATASLKWAVEEMEKRYALFVDAGVRDIDRYNQTTDDQLPYIVIVIDELADLMMVSPQDVEDCIIRIAQKARACGIHLLLATQRPSVDVITGNIKANVPTRLAFAVFSQVDSRTILDQSGAERLLGRGDMLFLESGTTPVRLQGNFVSDDEIERITQAIKKQRKPSYLFSKEDLEQQVQSFDAGDDPLYMEALLFVADQGQASASGLQRRFRVGYNRAARLIEMMEADGYVAGQSGGKARAVLITREDAQAVADGSTLL